MVFLFLKWPFFSWDGFMDFFNCRSRQWGSDRQVYTWMMKFGN
jgi:hypothetical protein